MKFFWRFFMAFSLLSPVTAAENIFSLTSIATKTAPIMAIAPIVYDVLKHTKEHASENHITFGQSFRTLTTQRGFEPVLKGSVPRTFSNFIFLTGLYSSVSLSAVGTGILGFMIALGACGASEPDKALKSLTTVGVISPLVISSGTAFFATLFISPLNQMSSILKENYINQQTESFEGVLFRSFVQGYSPRSFAKTYFRNAFIFSLFGVSGTMYAFSSLE